MYLHFIDWREIRKMAAILRKDEINTKETRIKVESIDLGPDSRSGADSEGMT